jgi:hypothetical protein
VGAGFDCSVVATIVGFTGSLGEAPCTDEHEIVSRAKSRDKGADFAKIFLTRRMNESSPYIVV